MVDTNIKHRSEENKIRILNYDITFTCTINMIIVPFSDCLA